MAITVRLGLKPKPHFGQNEQGYYARVTFTIRNVDWPTETLADIFAALPAYGDTMGGTTLIGPEWKPPEFENLIVKDIAPTQPDRSKHNVWTAEVTFGPPGGTIDLDKQYVRWSGGTITRRVDVDLSGYPIGSRNWVEQLTGKPLGPNSMKRRRIQQVSLTNEHAEIGADVHMPVLEFEIQVPLRNSQWIPAYVVPTTTARGRVNGDVFSFYDEWGELFEIAKYWCLLRDVLVEPDSRLVRGHRMTYRFMIAGLDLPENLPHYWSRGLAGDYTNPGGHDDPAVPDPLPVGYGAFTTFMPYNEKNEFDFKDGEVPKPRDVRIFQAHRSYLFNTLPGIIP